MKRLTGFIVFLLLMLISGCSPMAYDDLSSNEGDNSLSGVDSNYEVTAKDNGNTIEVKFAIIPDAKAYGYGTSSTNVIQFSASDLKFSSGGYYTVTIDKSSSIFSSASSTVSRDAGNITFAIYASTESTPKDSWLRVKVVSVELNLTTAPDLTVSSRGKDSVILSANSEPMSGSMEYKIDYGPGKSVTFDSSDFPYPIDGIGTDALTLTVYHRYAGTIDYSSQIQSLSVPFFDEREGEIDVVISDDGSTIKASNLSEGCENIGIFSVSADGELISEPIYTQPYTGSSSVTFDSTAVFGEGFYAGNIRIVLYDSSAEDAAAILSSTVAYDNFAEIRKANEKVGRQSYNVIIPVSEKLSITSASISGANSICSVEEDGIHISTQYKEILSESPKVGSLDSMTDYVITLTLSIENYGQISEKIEFTTGSFKGTYLWTGNKSAVIKFETIVNEAPTESSYSYYIYTSPNDVVEGIDPGQYRLAPLYDSSLNKLPEFPVTNTDNFPDGYKWNEAKWNNSGYPVISIDSVTSGTENNNKDVISTLVKSTAKVEVMGIPFDSQATTQTDIKFYETIDGKCYMVFFNYIKESMGNLGNKFLNTNKESDKTKFEADEFYYALELQ